MLIGAILNGSLLAKEYCQPKFIKFALSAYGKSSGMMSRYSAAMV